jgi:hypothetical protein
MLPFNALISLILPSSIVISTRPVSESILARRAPRQSKSLVGVQLLDIFQIARQKVEIGDLPRLRANLAQYESGVNIVIP